MFKDPWKQRRPSDPFKPFDFWTNNYLATTPYLILSLVGQRTTSQGLLFHFGNGLGHGSMQPVLRTTLLGRLAFPPFGVGLSRPSKSNKAVPKRRRPNGLESLESFSQMRGGTSPLLPPSLLFGMILFLVIACLSEAAW